MYPHESLLIILNNLNVSLARFHNAYIFIQKLISKQKEKAQGIRKRVNIPFCQHYCGHRKSFHFHPIVPFNLPWPFYSIQLAVVTKRKSTKILCSILPFFEWKDFIILISSCNIERYYTSLIGFRVIGKTRKSSLVRLTKPIC